MEMRVEGMETEGMAMGAMAMETGRGGDEEDDDDDEESLPDLIERGDDSDSDSDSDYDPDDSNEEEEEDPKRDADLLRQPENACDRKLKAVYGGDCLHHNTGEHLHGGVANDEAMQFLYNLVVSYPHPLYSPPRGIAGNTFIEKQAKEFELVRTRETNSECALIFAACILRKERGISRASSIKRRILRMIELWDAGKIPELVEVETLR